MSKSELIQTILINDLVEKHGNKFNYYRDIVDAGLLDERIEYVIDYMEREPVSSLYDLENTRSSAIKRYKDETIADAIVATLEDPSNTTTTIKGLVNIFKIQTIIIKTLLERRDIDIKDIKSMDISPETQEKIEELSDSKHKHFEKLYKEENVAEREETQILMKDIIADLQKDNDKFPLNSKFDLAGVRITKIRALSKNGTTQLTNYTVNDIIGCFGAEKLQILNNYVGAKEQDLYKISYNEISNQYKPKNKKR